MTTDWGGVYYSETRSPAGAAERDTAVTAIDQPLDPVEAFRAHLKTVTPPLQPVSVKTYTSGFRRISRDLGTAGVLDRNVVTQYRDSMKQGTLNVFDATWKQLRTYLQKTDGLDIGEAPLRSRVRMCHPLMPDLTTLTGFFGNRLEGLRWGDLHRSHEPQAIRAGNRIYEFQLGLGAFVVPSDVFVVPMRGNPGVGMAAWHIEHIVNSGQHTTDGAPDHASVEFMELLCVGGVTGIALRQFALLLWQSRPKLMRHKTARATLKEWLDLAQKKDFGRLQAVMRTFAGEGPHGDLPVW